MPKENTETMLVKTGKGHALMSRTGPALLNDTPPHYGAPSALKRAERALTDLVCERIAMLERNEGKSGCLLASDGRNVIDRPPHYACASRLGRGDFPKACEGEVKRKYSKQWLAEHPEVRPDPESWRALYTVEYERLQTLPEGYTDCLSRREAVNVIGDGWAIRVIEYLLSGLKDADVEPVTAPEKPARKGQLNLFGEES